MTDTTIRRAARKDYGFTPIDNEVFNDTIGLSWEAIGLLCYLLSKPMNWKTSPKSLANTKRCGINKVHGLLKELREARFIVYKKLPTGYCEYICCDTQQAIEPNNEIDDLDYFPNHENPNQAFPNQDFHDVLEKKDTSQKKESLEKGAPKKKPTSKEKAAAFDWIAWSNETLPAFIPYELWIKWQKLRKASGCSMTQEVLGKHIDVLKQAHEKKYNITAVLELAIDGNGGKGWQGLKPTWIENALKPQRIAPRDYIDSTVVNPVEQSYSPMPVVQTAQVLQKEENPYGYD